MPTVKSTVNFNCPTSTGNFVVNCDLGGLKPTGIEIYVGSAIDTNSIADDNKGCIGYADSDLNMRCGGWQDEDGQGTTDTGRITSSSNVIYLPNNGNHETLDIEAAVPAGAFDTADQVTLNFSNVNAVNARECVAVVYANATCKVDHIAFTSNAEDSTVTESGLGITPRLIKFYFPSTGMDSSAAHVKHSLGIGCLNGSALPQGYQGFFSDEAVATSVCTSNYRWHSDSGNANSRIFSNTANNGGAENFKGELTDISPGSFEITIRDSNAGTQSLMYMAIETDANEVNLIDCNPTTVEIKSYTGMGFKSDQIHFVGGLIQTIGTQMTTTPGAGSMFAGAWEIRDGVDTVNIYNWWSYDGQGTSNTKTRLGISNIVFARDGVNTTYLSSTGPGDGDNTFDSDGFTLDMNNVANAVHFMALGFKEAEGGIGKLVNGGLVGTELINGSLVS